MPRRPSIEDRQTFFVEAGHLVRTVETRSGTEYRHRCALDSYREVARFVEEHAEEGVTTGMLWEGLPEVSCTQSAVALAFLKERGCVTVRYRRCYPASTVLFEDAMVEYHALEAASR